MLEELEGRVLFSADALGGLAGNLDSGNETALEADLNPGVQQTPLSTSGQAAVPTIHDESFRRELVFIDDTVQDYDALIDGLDDGTGRNFEVIVLSSEEDGLAQVGRALAEYDDIDAIHLFSHGDNDSLQLGATDVDLATLQSRADEVEAWRGALSESADLLIYGCNLAGSEDGLGLVNLFATLTGADVAASDDLTGSAELGGDWDLEYTHGEIETAIALGPGSPPSWQGTLDITSNLVAHLTFDADASDSSGNSYDGTLGDNAAVDTTPATNQVGPGKLTLDGTNDYVNLDSHASSLASIVEGTISAWITSRQPPTARFLTSAMAFRTVTTRGFT